MAIEIMIQPKVTGYRQLTPGEAALMNDIKALCNAPLMDGLIRFFGAYHAADRGQARAAAARAAASCSAAQRTPPRCMPPLPRMLRLNRISATG